MGMVLTLGCASQSLDRAELPTGDSKDLHQRADTIAVGFSPRSKLWAAQPRVKILRVSSWQFGAAGAQAPFPHPEKAPSTPPEHGGQRIEGFPPAAAPDGVDGVDGWANGDSRVRGSRAQVL